MIIYISIRNLRLRRPLCHNHYKLRSFGQIHQENLILLVLQSQKNRRPQSMSPQCMRPQSMSPQSMSPQSMRTAKIVPVPVVQILMSHSSAPSELTKTGILVWYLQSGGNLKISKHCWILQTEIWRLQRYVT